MTFLTKAHKLDKNHVPEELAFDPAIVKVIARVIAAVDRMFDEEERLVYEIRMQSLIHVESIVPQQRKKASHKEYTRYQKRLH
jgi:hypothetical protein